jgi:hypothetical protein
MSFTDFTPTPNIRIIKTGMIRWAGHVERVRKMTQECSILVGKLEMNRPLGTRVIDL